MQITWKQQEPIRLCGGYFLQLSNDASGKVTAAVRDGVDGQWQKVYQFWGAPSADLTANRDWKKLLLENFMVRFVSGAIEFTPKLKGGGILDPVTSVLSFVTASQIKSLGEQAETVVKVGGHEARATILQAEKSAANVTDKIGYETRRSLELAHQKTEQLVTQVGTESRLSIGKMGSESRHTTSLAALEVKGILGIAAKQSRLTFNEAGIETRKAIELMGSVAQESALLASGEIGHHIREVSSQSSKVLKDGGREAERLLMHASQEVSDVIDKGQDTINEVIESALRRLQEHEQKVISNIQQLVDGVMEQFVRQAKGLILDLGDQGRLLIRDVGDEIRISANQVLSKLFEGQEMLISQAGVEFRLSVQAFGHEIRSAMREIPHIAAMSGEAFGRGLSHGVLGEFLGTRKGADLKYKLQQLLTTRQHPVSIVDLLKFVEAQKQLQSKEKFELYRVVTNFFNHPGLFVGEIENSMLIIGAVALSDSGLKKYAQQLITAMPGHAPMILNNEGIRALERLKPRPVEVKGAIMEPIPPEVLLLEESENTAISLSLELERVQKESAKNTVIVEKLESELSESKDENTLLAAANAALQGEVEDFNKALAGLQLERDLQLSGKR